MKPAPEINASARPVRVAYIIEDGHGAHLWLDAAFNESFGRHGGRQSLVVPVMNGDIPGAYLNWLTAFDPDIAFVVASDNEKIAGLLEAKWSPLLIYPVKQRPGEEPRYRFALRDRALTSLSWLPFLKVTSGGFRARPEEILDCYPNWKDDGLITDNFGTLYHSVDSFPIHRQLSDIVRPLMLTPKDAPEDRWRFGIEGAEVTDGYEALSALTKSGRTISLAYLSNIQSKHMSIRSHDWTNSFCMVIGDTFVDRVCCWNCGLLFDDAQHQAYKTLRLPAAVANDEAKIERIKKFINGNNWITRYGSQPHVTIRSSSLSEAELKAFLERISGKGSWCVHQVERIKSIEDCCPPPPREREYQWMLVKSENTDVRTPLHHKQESTPVPQPFQLKNAPSAHPICSLGQWIAQCRIDRTNDHNLFSNLRDDWNIPRRKQLTRLFLDREARITSGGCLAVPADTGLTRIEITEPDDENFFATLLHEPAMYSYGDIRARDRYEVPYRYSRTSDKGRYLQGVLGMFGSLDYAYQVLTHSFWRRQFARLSSPSEDQYPRILATLKKRFAPQAGKYTFETQEQWEKLAKTVVSQAPNVRQPKHTVKLQDLVDDWKKHVGAVIDGNAHLHKHRDRILEEAEDEITRSLDNLCRVGAFHQGHGWTCRHCGYRNWTALDSLRATVECQVCHQERQTSSNLKFDFRLNEFLATCLREHDTLSVIWALGRLQRETRASSFIFSPQLELFRKYPEDQNDEADREIDILCAVDGKVVVGEVKASLAEVDARQLDNLVEVAREIQADIALVGAIDGDARILDAKLKYARVKVGPSTEVQGLVGGLFGDEIEHRLP